jgi:hypothetical protein
MRPHWQIDLVQLDQPPWSATRLGQMTGSAAQDVAGASTGTSMVRRGGRPTSQAGG